MAPTCLELLNRLTYKHKVTTFSAYKNITFFIAPQATANHKQYSEAALKCVISLRCLKWLGKCMVKLVITIMNISSQSGLEFWWIIAPAANSRDS